MNINIFNTQIEMIKKVAEALGGELLNEVAFVGGCTTGLLVTDEFTKESIRYTNDVDLIIHVIGHSNWTKFQKRLREHGFKASPTNDFICRMCLGDLEVDFMPDDSTLGFTNRWYPRAFQTAQNYFLTETITIKLITPPYFVATKLEAYNDRGNNDPLSSHDLEDILNLFDGRETIVDEISLAENNLHIYVAGELKKLLKHRDFQYLVQSTTKGNSGRAQIIFERLETVIKNADIQK